MPKNIDLKSLMKEAEKMQKQMAEQQAKFDDIIVEGSSGGGMVSVKATANQKLKSIKLEKEIVNPEDVTMLEDLILSAVNNALQKAEETAHSEMNKISSGLMPGLKMK
jgi:nucleoid-associated protein EbfC